MQGAVGHLPHSLRHPIRDQDTSTRSFFELLSPAQKAGITHIVECVCHSRAESYGSCGRPAARPACGPAQWLHGLLLVGVLAISDSREASA